MGRYMHQTVLFSVYLFSDCLNENLLFLQIPIHSEYVRTKLHIGKTKPKRFEEIHLSAKKRQQKVFLFTFCISCDLKIYPTHLIPTAGAHG